MVISYLLSRVPPQCYRCNSKIKYGIKTVKRGKIDTSNTEIHDRSLPRLGTGTSINSGGVKLALSGQASPLSDMTRSCIFSGVFNDLDTIVQHIVCQCVIV